jgi:hypothetical protein
MASMHVSKKEAESEAMQIAQAFIAASTPESRGDCIAARPDILSPGYKRRKGIIKWSVTVRWTSEDGIRCKQLWIPN